MNMRKVNPKSHLMGLNSDMGLTTKKLQSQITKSECPHYYELILSNGSKRHCGTIKDVESMLSIYPDATYKKILLPYPPEVVDVPFVRVAPDLELPMQQILNESELQPIDLT